MVQVAQLSNMAFDNTVFTKRGVVVSSWQEVQYSHMCGLHNIDNGMRCYCNKTGIVF